jgi:hypothetical protein
MFPRHRARFKLIRTANDGHYICTLHLTKYFFPPIHLVEKGLKRPYFLLTLGQANIPAGQPRATIAVKFEEICDIRVPAPIEDRQKGATHGLICALYFHAA